MPIDPAAILAEAAIQRGQMEGQPHMAAADTLTKIADLLFQTISRQQDRKTEQSRYDADLGFKKEAAAEEQRRHEEELAEKVEARKESVRQFDVREKRLAGPEKRAKATEDSDRQKRQAAIEGRRDRLLEQAIRIHQPPEGSVREIDFAKVEATYKKLLKMSKLEDIEGSPRPIFEEAARKYQEAVRKYQEMRDRMGDTTGLGSAPSTPLTPQQESPMPNMGGTIPGLMPSPPPSAPTTQDIDRARLILESILGGATPVLPPEVYDYYLRQSETLNFPSKVYRGDRR